MNKIKFLTLTMFASLSATHGMDTPQTEEDMRGNPGY